MQPEKIFFKATPFTLATNVANALFYTKTIVKKQEKVTILEKENNVCGWQTVNMALKLSSKLELNAHVFKR